MPEPDAAPPPPPAEVRLDVVLLGDHTVDRRDCPPKALKALKRGWRKNSDVKLVPKLDGCLRGTLIGDSVVVYASSPPRDFDVHAGWPVRRVIMSTSGKLLHEGPEGSETTDTNPPSLGALADLDNDGVHEIIDAGAQSQNMEFLVNVFRVDGGTMRRVGALPYDACTEWSIGDPGNDGHRAIVLIRKRPDFESNQCQDIAQPATTYFYLEGETMAEQPQRL